jgi:hypothetical protein
MSQIAKTTHERRHAEHEDPRPGAEPGGHLQSEYGEPVDLIAKGRVLALVVGQQVLFPIGPLETSHVCFPRTLASQPPRSFDATFQRHGSTAGQVDFRRFSSGRESLHSVTGVGWSLFRHGLRPATTLRLVVGLETRQPLPPARRFSLGNNDGRAATPPVHRNPQASPE